MFADVLLTGDGPYVWDATKPLRSFLLDHLKLFSLSVPKPNKNIALDLFA